jgi:stringent starvation protein B
MRNWPAGQSITRCNKLSSQLQNRLLERILLIRIHCLSDWTGNTQVHNHSAEVAMKKVSLAILISLSAVTGAAYAQDNGITMSTDPAKVADVEQRAQDLQNRQQAMSNSSSMSEKHHKTTPHHHKKPDASGT